MNILFMCVANSARSQMAEGLARKLLGHKHRVKSAGSKPSRVNPLALEALREIGYDATSHYSKTVEDLPKDFVEHLNYVVTLCAEEVCPVMITKAKKLHWPLPDPAGQPGTHEEQLERFREVRDEIQKRLLKLKDEFA